MKGGGRRTNDEEGWGINNKINNVSDQYMNYKIIHEITNRRLSMVFLYSDCLAVGKVLAIAVKYFFV